jgi:hypothetical protein
MNDLITIEQSTALTVFTKPDGLKGILDQIADEARSVALDVSTAKGRKEVASVAYKIARSKTYIDGVGKDLVAEMKELPKKVDASRKLARDFLDNLATEIRKPLDEWEAEQARIEAEKKAAEAAEALAKQIALDHEMALLMNDAYDRRKEDEARLAEETRLERERMIRMEAEEKARKDAERQILEANLARERAEREKLIAEETAKRAAEQERMLIKARERKIEEENAKRQADVEHRRSVNRMVLNDLMREGEITEDQAKKIVGAIATGKVNNVIINY